MNEKTKADYKKSLKKAGYPVGVMIGFDEIYNFAHEQGRMEGFETGVRNGAESALGKLEEAYTRGMQDANKVSSASFLACTAIALHELHGFASVRCKRVIDKISDMLITTLHPSQWVEECRKLGVVIDDEDVLQELDGGAEDA